MGEQLQAAQYRDLVVRWVGTERAYVRDNAQNMLISPAHAVDLPFDLGATTALGGEFRGTAMGSIADWLDREGDKLVGQEAVTLSTTPAWEDNSEGGGTLVPRPMTVRVFAARTPTGWQIHEGRFMPGLARSGDAHGSGDATRRGPWRMFWVVSDRPLPKTGPRQEESVSYLRTSPGLFAVARGGQSLLAWSLRGAVRRRGASCAGLSSAAGGDGQPQRSAPQSAARLPRGFLAST